MKRPGVISLLAAGIGAALAPLAVLAAPLAAGPPMLTPIAARDIAAACPGTSAFAYELVRGISGPDAAAAEPAFNACASTARLPGYHWKTEAANLALAAVLLTRGLIDHDAALTRRAAALTDDLRSRSIATDDDVRRWNAIPDRFDRKRSELVLLGFVPTRPDNSLLARPQYGERPWTENAAYINVAAQMDDAWIRTPRVLTGESTTLPLAAARP
jgi:hypothetical protein